MIDLRSDTVTRPTDAMRRAMAAAEVGDDVFGEDPSVARLEREVAARLGKEAALFVPSGTMANQIALLVHARPGDEVVVSEGTLRVVRVGRGRGVGGVQFAVAGAGPMFDVDALEAAVKPRVYYYPRTSLVSLENTHNRGGGRVLPQPLVEAVAARARWASPSTSTARASSTRPSRRAPPSPTSPRRPTRCRCASRRTRRAGGLAPRRRPARGSPPPTASARCSAAGCGRRAFLRPRRTTRSTIICRASPTTTPARASPTPPRARRGSRCSAPRPTS